MEELGLEYKNTSYPRVNNKAPAEYAKESRSSLGKAPVLHDGDLVLVESGAICESVEQLASKTTLRRNTDTCKRNTIQTIDCFLQNLNSELKHGCGCMRAKVNSCCMLWQSPMLDGEQRKTSSRMASNRCRTL